eukprot:m.148191 g.148191  ORF g.148191 m.148191 type:complete len:60 (+) comp30578_c1_seq1:882-1061(+)
MYVYLFSRLPSHEAAPPVPTTRIQFDSITPIYCFNPTIKLPTVYTTNQTIFPKNKTRNN